MITKLERYLAIYVSLKFNTHPVTELSKLLSWTRLPLESRVIFVFFAVAFFTDLRMAFFTA